MKLDKALIYITRAQFYQSDDTLAYLQQIMDQSKPSQNKRRKPNNTHNLFRVIVMLPVIAHWLPIKIKRELPRIMIPIGTEDSTFKPGIVGIIDNDAIFTVGFMDYILGICDQHPVLIHSITCLDKDTGYGRITLVSVVANKSTNLTTEKKKMISVKLLTIVIFHMLCCTKVEDNATIFSVNIGNTIDINLLIRMSFVRGSGIVIDTFDDVAETSKLNYPPYNIIYHTHQRGKPRSVHSSD